MLRRAVYIFFPLGRWCLCLSEGFFRSPIEFDLSNTLTFSPSCYPFSSDPFPLQPPFLWRCLPIKYMVPLFVTSYFSRCLAVTLIPSMQALSWIKLSPILSLYGRIYGITHPHPSFSPLMVATTAVRLSSLESIKTLFSLKHSTCSFWKTP